MRKVVTMGATILATLTLAACGSTSSSSSNSSSQNTTASSSSQKKLPAEYQSALNKAQTYSDTMHLSKKGLYRQLTSSSGEAFEKKPALYAVNHVKANWNENALAKAKDYQDQQSLSPARIKTQLTSSVGKQFTESQANYAVQHLNK
ncbi:Ltp family lipoprotein [Secundilactobacillus kimchicus]|nr:Ltp family lipoprotein [Secundilactobacillus kimchicus]